MWGQYILKPQQEEFQYMPETEDLTMHLADLFKIKTCQHALIPTSEGSWPILLSALTVKTVRKYMQKISVRLPERAVLNIYAKFADASGKVKEVIESSFLPQDWKKRYVEIWDKKLSILL